MSLNTLKKIGIGIVSIIVLIVIFQNIETVETQILFFSFKLPRAILLFLTTLIGFIVGLFAAYFLMKDGSSPGG